MTRPHCINFEASGVNNIDLWRPLVSRGCVANEFFMLSWRYGSHRTGRSLSERRPYSYFRSVALGAGQFLSGSSI